MAKKRSTRASADDGADGWVVRAPDPVADRHAVFDLAAKTFGRPYFGFYDFCRDVYCVDPVFDWARSRVGTLDGGLATLWGVWDHTIRVGRARLRVAGIGCVACRADLRGRGLLSKTARPSLDACQAAGYPLSMLFGIPDFYHRFDYVRAFDNVRFSSSPEALAALAGPGGARFAPTADMKPARVDESRRAEIDALYNAAHADAAGTLVRPFLPGRFPGDKYHSSRDRFRDAFYGWTADPKRPALAGYVGVEWNADAARLTVVECAGSVADALGAVLAIARDWTAREVVWDTIPPQGEMARTLRLG